MPAGGCDPASSTDRLADAMATRSDYLSNRPPGIPSSGLPHRPTRPETPCGDRRSLRRCSLDSTGSVRDIAARQRRVVACQATPGGCTWLWTPPLEFANHVSSVFLSHYDSHRLCKVVP